jgi:inhibitor of KinA sporulation pathway (predicted exonuclease)
MILSGHARWGFGLASPTITIFDLEYTAWECSMARHWLTPGEFKEVIQIGAVKLDADSFAVLDEFDCLVKPRINPRLSPYLEKLTGIGSDAVARQGLDFSEAYDRFVDFAAGGPIAAFGHDEYVLADNMRLYGITDARALPLFYDLRGWFAVQGLDPRGMASCDIGPMLGVPFQGHAHNALNDARSLASSMEAMVARGAKMRPAA